MIPVYFPFTFIPDSVAGILNSAFGGVIVYQPNGRLIDPKTIELADKKVIELRTPITGEESQLSVLCKDYQNWGWRHASNLAAVRVSDLNDSDDELFITRIRSQIVKNKNNMPPQPDEIFTARLFLQMAQYFDIQQDEIDRALMLSDVKKATMFSKLTGNENNVISVDDYFAVQDYGSDKTQSRMYAWAQLYLADEDLVPFFVTNSQASFDQLIAHAPECSEIYSWEGNPLLLNEVDRKKLTDYLKQLVMTKYNDDNLNGFPAVSTENMGKIRLRLFILPGMPPGRLINSVGSTVGSGIPSKYGSLNTLVCLMENKRLKKRTLDSIL